MHVDKVETPFWKSIHQLTSGCNLLMVEPTPDLKHKKQVVYGLCNVFIIILVIGRSIALHDIITGLPIFDCGTVERVYLSTQRIVVRTAPV